VTGSRKRASRRRCRGARIYGAEDALDAGLLDRVVAPTELLDLAISEARALADNTDSFRRDKQAHVGPLADRMRRQLTEGIELLSRLSI
jgi:enoyl-CoA hydratase/carnithine racemase